MAEASEHRSRKGSLPLHRAGVFDTRSRSARSSDRRPHRRASQWWRRPTVEPQNSMSRLRQPPAWPQGDGGVKSLGPFRGATGGQARAHFREIRQNFFCSQRGEGVGGGVRIQVTIQEGASHDEYRCKIFPSIWAKERLWLARNGTWLPRCSSPSARCRSRVTALNSGAGHRTNYV